MKYLTEGMEPKEALEYFENICGIPHGSGNEAELAKYIIEIEKKKGLETYEDRYGNVLVRLAASKGCENSPYFLMQAHMDMVCVKEDWCDINMEKEAVRLVKDGNILYAEGTSLGADNGVGLCNMLAVMTDESIKHPPMEFLFTVREETGLEGIKLFDTSILKSRRMLTMDCGDPGVLIIGSAGSMCYELEMGLEQEGFTGICYELKVSMLHGGHTGLEIGSGYANALTMISDILSELERHCGARLCSLVVGGGRGSIPNSALAKIAISKNEESSAKEITDKLVANFHSEFSETEPQMKWQFDIAEAPLKMLTEKSSCDLLDFVIFSSCGDLKRHVKDQKQVLGSALVKFTNLKDGIFTGQYTIRSNTDPYKYQLGRKFTRLCEKYNVSYKLIDDSPAWPEKAGLKLTEICVEVHEKCLGTKPSVELVHGGEEASIISYNIPEMEIVGYAPYSRGAHTTKEKLYLDTMIVFWRFLTELLNKLSEEK